MFSNPAVEEDIESGGVFTGKVQCGTDCLTDIRKHCAKPSLQHERMATHFDRVAGNTKFREKRQTWLAKILRTM
jgi:hypothetical protein